MRRVVLFSWAVLLSVFGSRGEAQQSSVVRVAGGVESPELQLTSIVDMLVTENRILVLDVDQQVRVLTLEGRLLHRFGGEGDGPGEFRQAVRLGMLGDSIWVVDSRNGRVSFFDRMGDLIRTSTIRSPQQSELLLPGLPHGLLADGGFISLPQYPIRAILQAPRVEIPLLLVREGRADTLMLRRPDRLWWQIPLGWDLTGQGPEMTAPYPFRPKNDFDVSTGGRVVAWFSIAADGTVTVSVLDTSEGRTVSFPVPGARVPLGDDTIDQVVQERTDLIVESLPPALAAIPRARVAESARRALQVPSFLPPVTGIRAESSGAAVWIRKEDRGGAYVTWERFNRQGVAERSLEVPDGIEVFDVESGALWGIQLDEFDVPVVVRVSPAGSFSLPPREP